MRKEEREGGKIGDSGREEYYIIVLYYLTLV